MSSPPLSHVIVVGGSLGGLMHALAILVQSPSTEITILERSSGPLLHDQGAGIVAGPEVQRFFAQYVHPERDIAVTSRQRLYLDRHGNEMGGKDGYLEDRAQQMTSWDLLYRLLRWRVDGMAATEYFEEATIGASKDRAEAGMPTNYGPFATYHADSTLTSLRSIGPTAGVEVSWTSSGETYSTTASLVIAADGARSSIRSLLLPTVTRSYSGYVALRGTVPESSLSPAAVAVFVERFTFFHSEGVQVLGYTIPGPAGSLKKGTRLVNWVWYRNYPEESSGLAELLTDTEGHLHHTTLPVNRMRPDIWQGQVDDAKKMLPPQFSELVAKTESPFVQAIMDVMSTENMLADGQVLLIGDALAGFRPHTAASTSQAARGAILLGEWIATRITRREYQEETMAFAREVQAHGVRIGERSQFGRHPLAG